MGDQSEKFGSLVISKEAFLSLMVRQLARGCSRPLGGLLTCAGG